jgi:signal transduction histidine kinase
LEQVRVHEVLDYTLRLLRDQIDRKRIQVNKGWAALQDGVMGNSYQLQQAFMNLVLNAIDSMQPGGLLTVATQSISGEGRGAVSAGSRELLLTISDSGCGISAENLRRLFEPFFTTKQGGTGLGLHITRRIVTQHEGTISVDSTLGAGTTFIVLLPLVERL